MRQIKTLVKFDTKNAHKKEMIVLMLLPGLTWESFTLEFDMIVFNIIVELFLI